MKTIGIKLADGSFYSVLEEGQPTEKTLELTTAHNNQTKIMVDLYRSATCSMEDAEYVDSLQIENLVAHPNGEPNIAFSVSIDEYNKLSAKIRDPETGEQSRTTITLVSRTLEERLNTDEYNISELQENKPSVAKKVAAGGGLLAAAAALMQAREEKNTAEEVEENEEPIVIEHEEMPVDDTMVDEAEVTDGMDFDDIDLGDDSDENEGEIKDEVELPAEEPVVEEALTQEPAKEELEDFDDLNLVNFEEEPAAKEELNDFDDLNLGSDLAEQEEIPSVFTAEEEESGELELKFPDDDEPTVDFEEQVQNEISESSDLDLPDFDGEEQQEQLSTADELDLPDFNFEETETVETSEETEESEFPLSEDFTATEETFADEELFTTDAEASEDVDIEMPSDDTVIGDFDVNTDDFAFDIPEDESNENNETETVEFEPEEDKSEETEKKGPGLLAMAEAMRESEEEKSELEVEQETDSFDFGAEDFGTEDFAADETIVEENTPNFDEEIPESDDELPDMSFDLPDDNTNDDFSLDEFDFAENTSVDEDDSLLTDDDFNFSPSTEASSNAISFSGLYDKETELGDSSSSFDDDEIEKKTKVPVIICIICAIICVLVTVLLLFVIPSKYNLINKQVKEKPVVEKVVEEVSEPEPVIEEEETPEPIYEPEPEPEPIPEAKEDEVIIIEQAEEVVPEQPPVVVEEKPKPKNITYKIKWGDTLWDIADTYYKNPWRYKYIARFNKIKDPDYIISGTYITIPAE